VLQNASHCYATRNCHVGKSKSKSTITKWVIPSRRQKLSIFIPTNDLPLTAVQFTRQVDNDTYNATVDPNDLYAFETTLANITDFEHVYLTPPLTYANENGTKYVWTATYDAYAGYLPEYHGVGNNGAQLEILNDPDNNNVGNAMQQSSSSSMPMAFLNVVDRSMFPNLV
jgi:hypothetical protein